MIVSMQPSRWFGALALLAASAAATCAHADPATDVDHGQILFRQGDYARAAPLLRGALEAIDQGRLNEADYLARCLTPLVEICIRTDRFDEALPLAIRLNRWLEKLPDDKDLRRRRRELQARLGDILSALGRQEEARAAWRKALEMRSSDDRLFSVWRLETSWKLVDPARNSAPWRARQAELAELAARLRNDLETQGGDLELQVRVAKVEASCLAALGKSSDAATVYRQLLNQLAVRPGRTEYLGLLVQLAVWERETGDLEASTRRLQGALAGLLAKGAEQNRAIVLEQLGLTLKQKGNARDAAKCWRMLIEAEQGDAAARPSRSAADRYASLNRVRTAYQELGESSQALRAAEEAQKLIGSLPSASPDMRRRTIDVLGTLYAANGQYQNAVKLFSESLELARADADAPLDAIPATLTNLGAAYLKLGRGDDAEHVFREALERSRQLYRVGDLPLAEVQSNLAAVVAKRGNYAEANGLLREAIAGATHAGSTGNALRAKLLEFLAMNYLSQGQRDRAAEQLQAAIKADPAPPQPSLDEARRLAERYLALAIIELSRNERDGAERAGRRAWALAKHHQLTADGVSAQAERLLGQIAAAKGDFNVAERHWLSALRSQQERNAPTEAARTLSDLAGLSVRRQDFAAAERYYRSALDQQADVHDLPILHYNILGNLGQVLYYGKGDRTAGLELLKQAADLLEVPRAATIGGGERQRAEFLARHSMAFDLLVDNSLAAGNVAEAFRYAERARNRTFLDQLQLAGVDLRDTLPEDVAADLRSREKTLAENLVSLRAQAIAERDKPEEDRRRRAEQVRASQQEYAQVWGEIRDASPFYREALAKRTTIGSLADVQSIAIPSDALMLFYVLGEFQSHLFVIGHAADDVKIFDLKLPPSLTKPESSDHPWLTRQLAVSLIDEYVAALRDVEGARGLANNVKSTKGHIPAERGQLITETVLPAAVRKYIAERAPDHAIVVPDGALHELPLECLVITPGTTPVFALDTLPPLTYAPSATILLSLVQRASAPKTDEARSLLTVGDPRYAQDQEVTAIAASRDAFVDLGGRLDALPGTREECRRAAEAFGADRSLMLLGDEATEPGVRRSIAQRRFIHLAAHGLVDEQTDNLFGAIALTPPSRFSADDDGFLMLHEIYALNLNGCELAALSACRTNVGGARPLEAGSTLARAFLAAGARRVICSQWNVDDAAGSELMARFWEEIAPAAKRGEPIHYARALRIAQRRIRQRPELVSAYYWSPFVLIGPATGQ